MAKKGGGGMAVIDYEMPVSWNDKGMDWENPDPRNADYLMAIRQALFERVYASRFYIGGRFDLLSPWRPARVQDVATCIGQIDYMAHNFLNTEYDYEKDPDAFPKTWTLRDLIECEGCEMYETAYPGMLLKDGGAWLRKVRSAIDKLTVIACPKACGRYIMRSGTEHDPPFEESISNALAYAFADGQPTESEFSRWGGTNTRICAWSGNNHWKTYNPGEEATKDNCDGYCGYARAGMAEIAKVAHYLPGRRFDLLAYVYAKRPTSLMSYSDEIATAIFDPGSSGFAEGINLVRARVDDASDIGLRIGSVDSIPRNTVVPVSDFDAEYKATWRRGAKRGYESQSWLYLDYNVEGGFNFRPDEEEDGDGG